MPNITEIGTKAKRFYRLALVRELLPETRTAACMRIIARGKDSVTVLHNPERKTARFGNVCACSNGWICPICSIRLAEQKAAILRRGLETATNVYPALITFTMQHNAGQPLKQTLDRLRSSYRSIQQSTAFRGLAKDAGWLSSITALEVTHGLNGWHPHLHCLALFDRNYDSGSIQAFEFKLFEIWQEHLRKHSADCDSEHGVDAKSATYSVADYVSKFGKEPQDVSGREGWGIESELSRQHYKVARASESRSPQGVLLDSRGDPGSRDGRLYIEFARATKGCKILTVSAKAKALLGLDAIDDDELLNETTNPVEQLIAELNRTQWRKLIYPDDRREELIAIASQGLSDDLTNFIQSLDNM